MKRVQDIVELSGVTYFKIWRDIKESNTSHNKHTINSDDIIFMFRTSNIFAMFIACDYETFLDCQVRVVGKRNEL